MTSRLLKYAGVAILLVLVAVFAAAWWLTRSESGAQWLWRTATGYAPGEVSVGSVSGSLAGGIELLEIDYRSDAVDVRAERLMLALDLVLFPEVRVNVRELAADGVTVRQKGTEEPQEPQEPVLPRLSLPFEVNVQRLAVADLRVLTAAGDERVAIERVEAAGRWHETIALTEFLIESAGGRVEGSARLGLMSPHAAGLDVEVRHEIEMEDGAWQPLDLTLRADGSLEELDVDLRARQPELIATGTVRGLLDEPGWNLRVQATHLQWPLAVSSPQVRLRRLDLESSGSVSDYSVAAEGMVAVAEQDEHAFSLAGSGDAGAFEAARLEVDGGLLRATASGALSWEDALGIEVDAQVRRFDPAPLTEMWPADTPVEGVVDAAWRAGRIRIGELEARVPATGAAVDATGVVDPELGVVELDLDWRDLRWPLRLPEDANERRYESEFGIVRVTGSPESWEFDGRLAFSAGELPQGVFQLSGSGNRDEVRATLDRSEVLGGNVQGEVAFNWRNGGSWSAQLQTAEVELDPLLPAWPATVTGEFSTEGSLRPLAFQADIERLEGTLRDRPFTAEGAVSYSPGDVGAQRLQVRAGGSSLRADGRLQSARGLDFTVDVDSIARYYADLSGSLAGSGNLSLADGFPRLRLDLQGEDLLWREYGLGELAITDPGVPGDHAIALAARGEGLTVGTREFDSLQLQLVADEERQQLELELSPAGETIRLGMEGAFADPDDPLSGWSGSLQSLQLDAPEVASFDLEQPADLYLSPERVEVGRMCLAGDADASFCVAGSWHGGTAVDVEAELEEMPVALVSLLIDTELEFTQALDGSLRFSNTSGPAAAAARLEISPGSIRAPRGPQRALQTAAGSLTVDLTDGRTLSGELQLPFADASEIDARFVLGDINAGSESTLEGEARIDLGDLGLVARLLPVLDAAAGRLDMAATFDGTLGEPDWVGDVVLQDGAVRYSPLGIALQDLQLEAHVEENGRIELASTFTAGEGRGAIRTTSDTLAQGLELSVTGENLTMIDLPDISVTADVDLGLQLQDDRLVMNGGVLVPRARITPVNLTSDQINESDDVVIAGATPEEAEEAEDDDRPFAIIGTVGVELGRDVVVDLDVAEARLTGTTAFAWNGPPMPVAHGQYNIRGRFEAYGQVLDITEGTIRFDGVSPANPELRIRAEREIFGNPQIRSAGVLVTGTAGNPEIEVYTSPATTQDRALTLLVTGSDFNYEQGVGAVDVGTYIAPDLYISYGIGLFERDNVISLRYDFGKGFGIKATSGKRAEGVDLSYTIER